MDKQDVEKALLEAVPVRLREEGVHLRFFTDNTNEGVEATGIAEVRYGDQYELYDVEIAVPVQRANLRAARTGVPTHPNRPVLLITDYVNPREAQRLRAAGTQFADAAGNAYFTGKNLLIYIRGRPKNDQVTLEFPTVGRAYEAPGLRLIYLLLTQPHYLNRPYREIAAAAGIAHGTVGGAMADLEAQGILTNMNPGQRRNRQLLLKRERLIPKWIEGYRRHLRPKQLLARYRVDHFADWIADLRLHPGMQIGGEIAAARMTNYLKPATATLWINDRVPLFVMENRLIHDPDGNVEFLRKFWTQELEPNAQLVPPLLVYADLLNLDDARAAEAAEHLRPRVYD